jgi:hypothetical protein
MAQHVLALRSAAAAESSAPCRNWLVNDGFAPHLGRSWRSLRPQKRTLLVSTPGAR